VPSRHGVVSGCLLGVTSGWNFGVVGAIASRLGRDFDTSLVMVGLFTTALLVTHTLVQVPGGRASDRFGPVRAGAAGLLLIAAGDALALLAPEPALMLLGRAVTGLGTGLAFIAGSALVRVSGGSPFAQGVFGGLGLGAGGLALATVPAAADALGWRAGFWLSMALALAGLAVLVGGAHGTRPAAAPAVAPAGAGRRPPQARAQLGRLAVLYSASYGLSLVCGNWVVELLQRHGDLGESAAGTVGSLTLLLVVVTRPLGGWILRARRGGARAAVAASIAAGAVGTAALAAATPTWVAVTGAVLVGVGAGIPFSAAFTGAAVVRPEAPAAAMGAVNATANAVALVGTPLVGLSFSLSGGGRAGFAVLAALWLAALALLPGRAVFAAAGR
jgi:MFS family permease